MNETETFQHYQVLRRDDGSLWELGRGAMGVTYKAFDVNLRCEVALKVISSQYLDSETARARFLREARAAAGLRHRNVASVYHLGNDAQSFFYSMEFIDGDTLESLVSSQGPLPCAQALGIALQVTRALGAASKQGLVHRDIKPANIMVVREEDEDALEVKVIDFGLARLAVSGEPSGSITMGGFVGTPQYASPEQIEEKDLDVRSDIYSLGVTLWYMLAGQPPFTGSVFRISSQHLTAEPPFGQLAATVPPSVRDLLGRMLQKDPAHRPQTPAKLRAEIEICLGELSGVSALSAASVRRPPAAPATTAATGTDVPEVDAGAVTVVQGPAPTSGTIFAGRYQLAELAGEGESGKVYRAFDGRLDGRTVAVKVLHPHVRLSPQEFYHLQSDLGRLRDAPHPRLIDTLSLERIHGYKFVVMDWINGFSLTRLLQLGGPLSLRDSLHFLGQAADAAGHCSSHRLHRLELAPHQILTHFQDAARDEVTPDHAAILARPIIEWPAFTLKVDALAPAREASHAASPGGARVPGRDTFTSIRGLIEGSYFRALGLLFHELLSGANPVLDGPGAPGPLPALSEQGNAVLARALSTNPGFATEREFFFTLLDAAGLSAEEVGIARTAADQVSSWHSGSDAFQRSTAPTSAPTAVPPPPVAPGPADSAGTDAAAITRLPPEPPPKPAFVPGATQARLPETAVPFVNRPPDAPTVVPVTTRAPSPTGAPEPTALRAAPEAVPTVVPPVVVARAPEPEPAPEPAEDSASAQMPEPPPAPAVEPPPVLAPLSLTIPDALEPAPVEPANAPDPAPPIGDQRADAETFATEFPVDVPQDEPVPAPESTVEAKAEPPPVPEPVAASVFHDSSPAIEAEAAPLPEPVPPTRVVEAAVEEEAAPPPEPVAPMVAERILQLAPVLTVAPLAEPTPTAKLPPPASAVPAERVPEPPKPTDEPAEIPARPARLPLPRVEPASAAEIIAPIIEARSQAQPPLTARPATPPPSAAPTLFPGPRAGISPAVEAAPTVFPAEPVKRPNAPARAADASEVARIDQVPPAKSAPPGPPPGFPAPAPPAETPLPDDTRPPGDDAPAVEPAPPGKKFPLIPVAAGVLGLVVIGSGILTLRHRSEMPSPSPGKKISGEAPTTQGSPTPAPPLPPMVASIPTPAPTPVPTPINVPTATPLPAEPTPVLDTSPLATPTPTLAPTPVPTVSSTPPPPPAASDHPGTSLPPHAAASPTRAAKPVPTPRDLHQSPPPAHPSPSPKAKAPVNKPTPRPPGKPTPPPSDDVPGFMR